MLALAVAFLLAALTAFAVATVEVAVVSLSEEAIEEMSSTGRFSARFVAALKTRPVAFLTTVWALRIVAIAVAALTAWGATIGVLDLGAIAAVIAVGIAVGVLLLGEVFAKTLALGQPQRVCLTLSFPLWLVSRALLVVIGPVEALTRYLSKGLVDRLPRLSHREIRDLVSPGSSEEAIDEHERLLIQRAILLDETTAYDVMVPRVDMFAWSETRTLADVTPELRNVRYSRVPLYNGSIDKITGVLYIRDAFQALVSGQRDVELRALAREPFFVPGSVTLDRLLLDFQTRRIHLGIVIDEYGGVDGVITLEDILEELVGEIVDESDVAADPIIRLSRNEILVDGGADLREINHFFNTTFPQLEHRSLNGYLLDVLGQVPSRGEKIIKEGVRIEVTNATETQVLQARLSWVGHGKGAAGEGGSVGPAAKEGRSPEAGEDRSAGSAASR